MKNPGLQKKNRDKKKAQHNKEREQQTQQKEQPSTNQQANAQTVENVGYPDISKANTKVIVVVSLIFVLIILFLSILFPSSETEQQDSTTEATTENEITANKDAKNGFTIIDNETFYYPDDETKYTGWYKINDATYYFDEDGVMATGWYTLDGHQYYFDEDGVMQTNQWIEDKYVGEDGYILKNTVTPDGGYVDENGIRNDEVSLTTSRAGLTDLKEELQTMVDSYSGTWSIYVKDVSINEYMVINNVQHFSASLIKLYCAAAAYDLIDKGNLEESETIDRLMQEMISVSDNDAFNLMVMNCAPDHSHVTGRSIIQEYIDANGYTDTTITSILVPSKYTAPSSPGRNCTSVVDCGLLLEKIYKGQCVNAEASQKFLDLLLQQTHVDKIPAGLPEETKCANKTGDTNEVQHDAAIVYSPSGVYILCVMSSNCGTAISNMQTISRTVYEYFNASETAVTSQYKISISEDSATALENDTTIIISSENANS